MRKFFTTIIILGQFLIFNNLAFTDNVQETNCDEIGCSGCQQIYSDMGKTEYNYKNGEFDGLQKVYYKNGNLLEEFTYKDGKIDGESKFYYEDGQLWDKQIFKQGLLLDEKKQPKNGFYKRFYKNGKLASDVLYKNGLPEGESKSYYENGAIKGARIHFSSTNYLLKTYNENGTLRFQATIKNDKYDGKITSNYDNGKLRYEMFLKNDIPYGTKKDYLEDGTLRDEFSFINGFNKWKYTEFYKNGKILSLGFYSGNIFNQKEYKTIGLIKQFYENGKLRQKGAWDGKQWIGPLVEYYDNGRLKDKINYINGKRDGMVVGYYKNGKIQYEMFFKNDIPIGIEKNYTQKGVLQYEYKFLDGFNRWELVEYFTNGKIKRSGGSIGEKDPQWEGLYKEFYENGQLKSEVEYKRNKKEGVQRDYSPDGKLKNELKSKDGIDESYLELEKQDALLLEESGSFEKVVENISPADIFEKVKNVYKTLETYKAHGIVITTTEVNEKKTSTHTDFDLNLKKPNLYLISWRQNNKWMVDSGTVWNSGGDPYLYREHMGAYEQMPDDQKALAFATGMSGGSSFTILSLFLTILKSDYANFDKLIDPKVEGIGKINGEDCYVISGSSRFSKSIKYWISKSRFLILKHIRSLEYPAEKSKNIITDKEFDDILKKEGKVLSENLRSKLRESLKESENLHFKGVVTEIYSNISSPKLESKDFHFQLPQGTLLQKSVYEDIKFE